MDNTTQNKLADKFAKRFEDYNSKVLEELAEIIKKFKGLTYSEASQLAQQLKYDKSYTDLVDELAKLTGKTKKEIKEVLEEVIEQHIEFADVFFKARGLDTPIYKNDAILQDLVKSIATVSEGDFTNIARSTGFYFLGKDDEPLFLNMKETYYKVIDECVYAVSEGKETYDETMRNTISQLYQSGVRKIVYNNDGKQQYTQRIDTAVRRNVLDSVRQVSMEVQQEFGKRFDADGIEVTVHSNPAPDHENVQGKQFSTNVYDDEGNLIQEGEFEKFQTDQDCYSYDGEFFPAKSEETGYDRRSIGQYNCYHNIFSIILGVSDPLYSDDELQKIKEQANEEIDIDGKKYTRYEVTQLQRQIETQLRKEKDAQMMYLKTGDRAEAEKHQLKITQLTRKYKEISKKAGIREQLNRATVSGYRPIKISEEVSKVQKAKTLQKTGSIDFKKYRDFIDETKPETIFKKFDWESFMQDYDKLYNKIGEDDLKKAFDEYTEWYKLDTNPSHPFGKLLNKKLGYDGLPELIDEKDFWVDEYGDPIEKGDTYNLDTNRWFRGIAKLDNGKDYNLEETKKYVDEFKHGEFYAGKGIDGNGTYATKSYSYAERFTMHHDEGMVYIIPKDDAKTIGIDKLYQISRNLYPHIDETKGDFYVNVTISILKDPGYLAEVLGYDIVDVGTHKIILNRGAIKVVK